jgi:competence protein ComFC
MKYHVPQFFMTSKQSPLARKMGKKYAEKKVLVTKPSYPIAEATELLTQLTTSLFRRLSRGYNQAEVIAKAYAHHLSLPYSHILRRRHSTQKVKLGSRFKRLHAARTMYLHKNCNVQGKDIILIDDVTTTGATLFEAHKILKQAGARTVQAITLAH